MEIFYYRTAAGREAVKEYVDSLETAGEAKAVAAIIGLLDILEELGHSIHPPRSDLIDKGYRIYELRPGDHRIAFAFRGNRAVLLQAWRKRSQKLDRQERDRARRNLEDWDARHA